MRKLSVKRQMSLKKNVEIVKELMEHVVYS